MSIAVSIRVNFHDVGQCSECGSIIVLSERKYSDAKEKGVRFYCENGHHQVFVTNENQKLRQQLEMKERQIKGITESRDWYERRLKTEQKTSAAFKGQITKIKNRVGNGVCPCCNRTFQNLQRHMTCKHPDYKND